MATLEIKAEYDEHSMGKTRDHYVFPKGFKRGAERAAHPSITGGLYIRKGDPIPETIVIHLTRATEEQTEGL